ncbi:NAC domain-containing 89-like [Olea europaea subsp. europaea]|uniref:NAC domain-containing 89-like n=1 Tax=Olea europaea subsp. europaea TaxID=158383 RepID=A0A8S0TQY5_OLEEU|nr:NAC domain-containing 89-like [Olea europaea subsp. europaea]
MTRAVFKLPRHVLLHCGTNLIKRNQSSTNSKLVAEFQFDSVLNFLRLLRYILRFKLQRKRVSLAYEFVQEMGEDSERIEGSSSRNISEIPMEISMADVSLFPGFRFSPTDEELIEYYLKKKIIGSDDCVEVIPEVDICRHEPWDLPAQSIIQSDNEWFFFTPRGRKYPKGSQSKRATEFGYWKATGKERTVKSGSNLVGTKRTLVFHIGRAPKGQRTEWIMHEYCTSEKSQDTMVVCRLRKNSEFHINDNQGISSLIESDMSVVNDVTTTLYGVEQSGMVEGTKVGESCSKEYSSIYNSHSVEQVDSGSESGEKVTEFNQHNSSSNEKVLFTYSCSVGNCLYLHI